MELLLASILAIYSTFVWTYFTGGLPVAFSPDGRTALVGTLQWGAAWGGEECAGELILWDLATGQEIRRFEPTPSVLDVSISPDGRQAVTGVSNCGNATLWDVETGQPILQLDYVSLAVSFTSDSLHLVVGSVGGYVVLVDAKTGEVIRRFMGLADSPFSLDISADEKYLLAGDPKGQMILWNFETGEEIQRFYGHSQTTPVWNIVFSPDGQTAFSSSLDPQGDVIQWRIAEWSLDELRAWIKDNRYVRDLTCEERAQYNVEPLCE